MLDSSLEKTIKRTDCTETGRFLFHFFFRKKFNSTTDWTQCIHSFIHCSYYYVYWNKVLRGNSRSFSFLCLICYAKYELNFEPRANEGNCIGKTSQKLQFSIAILCVIFMVRFDLVIRCYCCCSSHYFVVVFYIFFFCSPHPIYIQRAPCIFIAMECIKSRVFISTRCSKMKKKQQKINWSIESSKE